MKKGTLQSARQTPFSPRRRDFMNFIDLIILVVVLGALGAIAYFNFIKKDRDACRSCPYKKDNCDCGKKK